MTEVDPFAGMNEVKTSTIKWGKVGNWFKGTLTDNTRQQQNQLSKDKEMQAVYEFKIAGGSFNGINPDKSISPDPTVLEAGSFWTVYGKGAVQGQMRNAKLGQIVGMRFVEEKASKQPGFNPTKVIKVFLGDMDPTYQGETAADFSSAPKLD